MIWSKCKNPILQQGFTLVEMLVYLAIFITVSTTAVYFLISLDDVIDEYRLETMVYRSGSGAMEQIILALRQSDQVDPLNTTIEAPLTGRLTLQSDATTTEFAINSGALNLTIDGVSYGDLTGSEVTVDGFTVYRYPVAHGELVRVRLDLTATLDSSGSSKSVTLYGGSVIRGSI